MRKVIFESDLKTLNENLPDCEGKNAHARERELQVQGHRVMDEQRVSDIQRMVGTFVLMQWRLKNKR